MNTKLFTSIILYFLYSGFVYLMISFVKFDLNILNFSYNERVTLMVFGFILGLWFAALPFMSKFDFFKKS
jgi:hypothetical protein